MCTEEQMVESSRHGAMICRACARLTGGRVKCKKCAGMGKFRCPNCKQGVVECPSCRGKRKVTVGCSGCRGTGLLKPPPEIKLKPVEPGTRAALELQKKRVGIKLRLIELKDEMTRLQRQLAEIEAQLSTPAEKEPEKKKPPKKGSGTGDDF